MLYLQFFSHCAISVNILDMIAIFATTSKINQDIILLNKIYFTSKCKVVDCIWSFVSDKCTILYTKKSNYSLSYKLKMWNKENWWNAEV